MLPQRPMANPLLGPSSAPPIAAALPSSPPDPDALATAHQHFGIVTSELMKLIATPQGRLTKQDVLGGAADMIKAGAFPEPAQRQQLIAQLASLPNDEADLRAFLGRTLMAFANLQTRVKGMMAAPPGGGPPGAGGG